MKWNRTRIGDYRSEDGKYEIHKYRSMFELNSLTEKAPRGGVRKYMGNKLIGSFYTLREAKAAAEKYEEARNHD